MSSSPPSLSLPPSFPPSLCLCVSVSSRRTPFERTLVHSRTPVFPRSCLLPRVETTDVRRSRTRLSALSHVWLGRPGGRFQSDGGSSDCTVMVLYEPSSSAPSGIINSETSTTRHPSVRPSVRPSVARPRQRTGYFSFPGHLPPGQCHAPLVMVRVFGGAT